MAEPVIPLAAGFASASEDDWRTLAARTLKGAAVETLVRRTADAIAIAPLYGPIRQGEGRPFRAAPRGGERPWDVRAAVAHPAPASANAQILADLAGGAASVLLSVDPQGQTGTAVGSSEGLAAVLGGVLTDLAPVAVDAGFLGPACADWLSAAAKASPAAALAFHLDPLSAFAAAGLSPGPMEAHLIAAAGVGAGLAATHPRATLFLASGRTVHEAGGSEAWELAFAAAATVTYARALVRAGLKVEDAFARIVLGLAVDDQPFLAIAKLRAGRQIMARIAQACGAPDATVRLEARASRRMLTLADPWTNLVRLTAAGFSAAVGGADAIVLRAFTDAQGPPTEHARRMARNTQLILMEEAHLGAVADPLGGAWSVEALSRDLARAAWDSFQAIEAAGGALEALRDGSVAAATQSAREALAAALAAGERRVVGVTDFTGEPETAARTDPTAVADPVPAPDPRLPGPDSHCPALPALRLEELAA